MITAPPAVVKSDREIDALAAEYEAWNHENGLSLSSADEHVFDEDLTEEQRDWLKRFCERWEAACETSKLAVKNPCQ